MTNKTPQADLQSAKDRIKRYADQNDIDDADSSLILEYCRAYEEENIMVSKPAGDSHKELSTLRSYVNNLGRVARHQPLHDATPDDINRVVQSFLTGSAELVKDGGLAKSTCRTYQMVLKSFYGYHDTILDPSEISSLSEQHSPIDPDDMLTRDEIHELRETATHPRDRAIVDMFLYTGQRATALRTLKVKHVNIQDGTYSLNSEAHGLKGADKNANRRPLLLAEPSVRTWLQSHPEREPEAYLLTAKPRYKTPDPYEPISHDVFTYTMSMLKDKTDIDKPLHPHSLRHNFVTICKRDYDMDNETIKHLIGHSPGSRVMETTYSHLSDEDYIKAARKAADLYDGDTEESALTPQICSNCGAPAGPSDVACSDCGLDFTPSSVEAQNVLQEKSRETMEGADTPKDAVAADDLIQIAKNNPEATVKMLQELQDEL